MAVLSVNSKSHQCRLVQSTSRCKWTTNQPMQLSTRAPPSPSFIKIYLRTIHHKKFVYKTRQCTTANATPLNIIGQIELEIKIKHVKTYVTADVATNLITKLLLGNNWINEHHVHLFGDQQQLAIPDEHGPASSYSLHRTRPSAIPRTPDEPNYSRSSIASINRSRNTTGGRNQSSIRTRCDITARNSHSSLTLLLNVSNHINACSRDKCSWSATNDSQNTRKSERSSKIQACRYASRQPRRHRTH